MLRHEELCVLFKQALVRPSPCCVHAVCMLHVQLRQAAESTAVPANDKAQQQDVCLVWCKALMQPLLWQLSVQATQQPKMAAHMMSVLLLPSGR